MKRREFLLELIREMPHVRTDKSEGSGSYPYVHESFRVGMWYARVTSVSVSEVLLHLAFTLFQTAEISFRSLLIRFFPGLRIVKFWAVCFISARDTCIVKAGKMIYTCHEYLTELNYHRHVKIYTIK